MNSIIPGDPATLAALTGLVVVPVVGYRIGKSRIKQSTPTTPTENHGTGAGSGDKRVAVVTGVVLALLLLGVFVVNFDMVQPTMAAFGWSPVVAAVGAIVLDLLHAIGAATWVAVPHARGEGALLTATAAYVAILLNMAGHELAAGAVAAELTWAMIPTTVALPTLVVVVAHVSASVVIPVIEGRQVSSHADNAGSEVVTESAAVSSHADKQADNDNGRADKRNGEVSTDATDLVSSADNSNSEVVAESAAVSSHADNDDDKADKAAADDKGRELADTQPMPRVVRDSHNAHTPARRDQTPRSRQQGASEQTSGAVKTAMRAVWDRHVAAGTAHDLTGQALADEAGCGTRQSGNNYLKTWRAELSNAALGGNDGTHAPRDLVSAS